MTDFESEYDWLLRLLPLAVGAGLILHFAVAAPEPAPPPDNALVFGCYSAEDAPPILLHEGGMQILQDGFPRIGFHLEQTKWGIYLTAEAPIKAEAAGASYRYAISGSGSGRYLPFYRIISGKVYGAYEESDLRGFRMLTTNGPYLVYDKADLSACALNAVQP